MSPEKDQISARHRPEEYLWDKETFPMYSGIKSTLQRPPPDSIHFRLLHDLNMAVVGSHEVEMLETCSHFFVTISPL